MGLILLGRATMQSEFFNTLVDNALYFMGAGENAPDSLREQTAKIARSLIETVRPRYTYRAFGLEFIERKIHLQGTNIVLSGNTASKMLAQCDSAVLLACTIGAGFDSMLRTEQVRDMAGAVILDACGSALVESGCDAAEDELSNRISGKFLTDRFSPGYSDLPLSLQPDICSALDSVRRLGLTVTDSLLLNPVKSVTAVIGISQEPQMARVRGCDYCSMRETCELHKGGKSCAI